MMMAKKRVWFVRHGQAEHNLPGKDSTIRDAHLTPLGVQQATDIPDKSLLTTQLIKEVDLVVVSPLTRAIQTAILSLQSIHENVPFVANSDIQEIGTSAADTGRDKSIIAEEFPKIDFTLLLENYFEKPPCYYSPPKVPGMSESLRYKSSVLLEDGQIALKGRLLAFTEWIRRRDEMSIVVVCHHGVLCHLLGIEFDNAEVVQTSIDETGSFSVEQSQSPLYRLFDEEGFPTCYRGSHPLSATEHTIQKRRGGDVLAISKALTQSEAASTSLSSALGVPLVFALDARTRNDILIQINCSSELEFLSRVHQAHAADDASFIEGHSPSHKHLVLPNYWGIKCSHVAISSDTKNLVRSSYVHDSSDPWALPLLTEHIDLSGAEGGEPPGPPPSLTPNRTQASHVGLVVCSREAKVAKGIARRDWDALATSNAAPWIIEAVQGLPSARPVPRQPAAFMRDAMAREHGGEDIPIDVTKYREAVAFWSEHVCAT